MRQELKDEFYYAQEGQAYRVGKKMLFGVALIIIGSLFLFERLGYLPNQSASQYWPFVFCVFGLNRLLFSQYTYRKIKGCLQIFIGFWVFACLQHLWGWTFSVTWPMILIALGLCYIGSFLFKNNRIDTGRPS